MHLAAKETSDPKPAPVDMPNQPQHGVIPAGACKFSTCKELYLDVPFVGHHPHGMGLWGTGVLGVEDRKLRSLGTEHGRFIRETGRKEKMGIFSKAAKSKKIKI